MSDNKETKQAPAVEAGAREEVEPVEHALSDEQVDAIEYALQALRQVEAGDGVFLGQCLNAIKGLEAILAAKGGGHV